MLKEIRESKKLSIYKLAELTGLTPGYINNLENGYKNNPTKETMEKIAIALGQTVPDIFFPDEE
ncbi:helix-turn-helix domain-containing protein [Clostridium magnum]|uniref:Helix-turn-helix protein n=1 Tax=Clostridium magnum DSM 2767 TaxID=1121326 RepID=A0A162UVC0_9CLOT|nr:helix-turn-helix transcriptional regulator [Clostridium magnum]KZL94325.1 helix-turn-helix protein [Clostridium magnum DSM 2767]SHJ54936.1 Helix-turn-helix [Clostridium magnum DSM 2767]